MIPLHATYVSNGIKLPEIEKKSEFPLLLKKRNRLIFESAPDQRFFVYSFGAFVFTGTDPKTAAKIIKKFGRALERPTDKEFTEEYGYEVIANDKDVVEFDVASVKSINLDKLSLLADVLAQSVAIDYFDYLTDEIIYKFEQVNIALERRGKLLTSGKLLNKTIGTANTILQSSITRMALLDKPELVWEEAELESFYLSLRKMFELDDRFRIIEFKTQYIRDTSELSLTMLTNHRMLILEAAIVFLFVVDLALFVFEILTK